MGISTNNFDNPASLGGPTWDAVDLGLEGFAIDQERHTVTQTL
jgi:hypothetical protein